MNPHPPTFPEGGLFVSQGYSLRVRRLIHRRILPGDWRGQWVPPSGSPSGPLQVTGVSLEEACTCVRCPGFGDRCPLVPGCSGH